jgi:erythronate-4-phosphate dehydrogenase
MKIVVDENIPFAVEAFSQLGEVVSAKGRAITRDLIRDADAVIVRSVTRVNADLLGGTKVRFVATATIGYDHVDVEYLRGRKIGFSSAPGSNANSVAEYVMAALLVLARRGGFRLEGKTIGVVGVGNVGSRVVRKADALGMKVLQNDPPLQRQTGEARFLPLEALLGADILTFHVPLTRRGPDATYHLIDERLLARLQGGVILINTSRGAVADSPAILEAVESHRLGGLVLDVFENEPKISLALVERADIATAHIAGYSFDGKVNGTAMIYRAACDFFDRPIEWDSDLVMPEPPHPQLAAHTDCDHEDALRDLVLTIYNIEADDRDLRQIRNSPPAEQGPHFDHLRKTYPVRREFQNTQVVAPRAPEALRAKIIGLGFRM